MTEEFGSGPELTEGLDFTVGPTGDISTVTGIEELKKDLSMSMIILLNNYVGTPPTPNTRSRLRRDVRGTALADTRISAAPGEDITITQENYEEISITMTVIAETGDEFEMVFST